LDDLVEESGPIFDGFCEYLKQIPLLIVIHQNFILLECIKILSNFNAYVRHILPDVVVVGIRYC
jgi:hypothetical protein